MKKFVATNSKIILFSFLTLVVGFVGGMLLPERLVETCDSSKYQFINPDLVCNDKPVVSKQGYATLRIKLDDFIAEATKEKKLDSISIYLRDLEDGPTMGIDEHEKFSPASLLKLPMLITYLNLEEDQPSLATTELSFKNFGQDMAQFYSPRQTIDADMPYTVDDLLGYMIKYSDNRSYYGLRQYLGQISPNSDLLQKTFTDLGIVDPKDFSDQTLSVKAYSSIFLQLYHNSFLPNKELSEKALDMLADTDFDSGLVAGVPEGTKVAHKFGERSNLPNGTKQLHDCGIVYYPGNPYLLCVMTRGDDFLQLSDVISAVSKMVYEEFDSRKL